MFGLNVRVGARFPWHPKRVSELQADPGVVRVVSTDGREQLGFGYFETTPDHRQTERWLLYRYPMGDFTMESAPLVESLTDLVGWARLVSLETALRTGYTYIKAISEVYTRRDEKWTEGIP